MIKKSFITLTVLFGIYTLFTIKGSPAWWLASQHQWQDNLIKAQRYMYDDTAAENVIIGSSLSCRLIMDSLPQMYNLSFSGQSIFDGLSILSHKKQLPKNVFIELNVVLRKENQQFTSSLNDPIFYFPRKILPSLRFDKQPLAVIGKVINQRITHRYLSRVKHHFNLDQSGTADNSTDLFSKMLKMQLEEYSKTPDKRILDECFVALKEYTDQLQQRGVHLVFFEMPVNYQLMDLPRATIIREAFYKQFPPSTYDYIPAPRFKKFETSDGVHLKPMEAAAYTSYFKSMIYDHSSGISRVAD